MRAEPSASGNVGARSRNTRLTSPAESPGQNMRPAEHDRTDGLQPELEVGDDAEVAAATVECPEEIWVFRVARRDQRSVGGDEFDGTQIVARKTVGPFQTSGTAAEGQACDSCERLGRPPLDARVPVGRGGGLRVGGRSVVLGAGVAPMPHCEPTRHCRGGTLVRTSGARGGPSEEEVS